MLLRDWDRSLRAGNRPETTRYNYVLAASQLADYLEEQLPKTGAAAGGVAGGYRGSAGQSGGYGRAGGGDRQR